MPISKEEFDGLPDDALDLAEGTNASLVLRFLAENPEQAFTRGEIRDATGVADGSIGPVLVRLRERGLVEHRGRYWAVGEDDRLGALAGIAHTYATVEDRYPPEDVAEWDEHAAESPE